MLAKFGGNTLGLMALLFAGSISSQEASPIKAFVPLADGGTNMVNDFEIVSAPQFLLAATGIDHKSVTLLCSRRWSGVLAEIDGVFGALNASAVSGLAAGLKIDAGRKVGVMAWNDPAFPLSAYGDNVSRLVERADKQCHPGVSTVKRGSPPRGELDYAYAICSAVDAAGIATEPCEVSGWDAAVKVTMDVHSAEAKRACGEIALASRERGWVFKPGWTVQIFSPFSDGKTIAYCKL